jgi:hypothetical protein
MFLSELCDLLGDGFRTVLERVTSNPHRLTVFITGLWKKRATRIPYHHPRTTFRPLRTYTRRGIS